MDTRIFHLAPFRVNRLIPPVERSVNCIIRKALSLKHFALLSSVETRLSDLSVARENDKCFDALGLLLSLGEGRKVSIAARVR